MKQVIAIILIIAIAAQTFDKAFITFGYYINTNTYAKDCENKDKPMLHCCGKCQLRKKLQQEARDKENPYRGFENRDEVVLSSKSFFATIVSPFIILTTSIKKSFQQNVNAVDRSLDIFHPPQV